MKNLKNTKKLTKYKTFEKYEKYEKYRVSQKIITLRFDSYFRNQGMDL